MNTECNQNETGNLAKQSHFGQQYLANPGCGSTKQDECDGESDDEHDRIQQDRSKKGGILLASLQLLERCSRNDRDISWNKGQNTGRQERNQTRDKCRKDRNVIHRTWSVEPAGPVTIRPRICAWCF